MMRATPANVANLRPAKFPRLENGAALEFWDFSAGGEDSASSDTDEEHTDLSASDEDSKSSASRDIEEEHGDHYYQNMFDAIAEEKSTAIERLGSYQARGTAADCRSCPFCPRLVFDRKSRLLHHINTFHESPHGCKFGKQLKVLKAVWAERGAAAAARVFFGTQAKQSSLPGPLQHSASIVRHMLEKSPSFQLMRTTIADWADASVWAFTEDGLQLVIKADTEALGLLRLGYMWYSPIALRMVLSMSMEPFAKGAARRVRALLRQHFTARCLPTPFLLPQQQIIQKLQSIGAAAADDTKARAIARLGHAGDFAAISIDDTYKFLMPVLGQPKHGASKAGRGREDDIHVVMTARSISGALFFAEPFFSEDAPAVAHKLANTIPAREAVRLLQVDRPYDWDVKKSSTPSPSSKQ